MSEYELVTLRNRLLRGSRNKAERGELFLHVPVGYFKTSSGEIVQEPDEQARGMVQLVFDKFEELASAYAVFRYFVANQLQLGFRPPSAARAGELEWRLPTPNCIPSTGGQSTLKPRLEGHSAPQEHLGQKTILPMTWRCTVLDFPCILHTKPDSEFL
jgi:hypothetical protein